jgi:hypothetical protein
MLLDYVVKVVVFTSYFAEQLRSIFAVAPHFSYIIAVFLRLIAYESKSYYLCTRNRQAGQPFVAREL